MRRSLRAAVALFLVALPACQSSKPADLPPLTIESVRVGIPAGPDSSRLRPGIWCPVYVTLKAGGTPITRDALRLVVKTNDADDTPFRYTRAIEAMGKDDRQTVVTYTRPGSAGAAIDVQVVAPDGRVAATLPRFQLNAARDAIEPKEPLLVAVGSSTLRPDPAAQVDEKEGAPPPKDPEITARNLAFLEGLDQMPDEWFGYEAVDVVVLTTGKDKFVDQLLTDATRRKALAEWVRRGGRLVVSVGKNYQLVDQFLGGGKDRLIACKKLGTPVTLASAPNVKDWAGFGNEAMKGLDVTVLEPLDEKDETPSGVAKDVTTLVAEEAADPAAKGKTVRRHVMVQGSYGLGRVVLIGFDVEASPFAVWNGRREFWEKLQKELRVRSDAVPKPVGPDGNNPNVNNPSEPAELLTELQRNLETFEEVPTLSFGWVALFTLFYIILIGPIDYFLLKKVFKRLEMTWVTFPATVLLVSATAYLTAYWVKGEDLHVKKLDLVEIDLHRNTACGTTWFALFSPRIQNYTVGVEPSAPWVASPGEDDRPIRSWNAKPATKNRPIHPTTVSVFSAPESGRRAVSAGLYPQPYDCTESATGLEKVPIPVWATRSFTASWTAPLPEKPPVAASLHLPRPDGGGAPLPLGEITNNLPVALESVALFYRNEWFKLGTLEPGETRSVGELFTGGPKKSREDWLNPKHEVLRPKDAPAVAGRRRGPVQKIDLDDERSSFLRAPHLLLKDAMFFSATDRPEWLNSGLRPLDQSWRLWKENAAEPGREEVILVARAGPLHDRAEKMTAAGIPPTALWLGALPGTATKRPPLDGLLTQETYVRVYIPVKRGQVAPVRRAEDSHPFGEAPMSEPGRSTAPLPETAVPGGSPESVISLPTVSGPAVPPGPPPVLVPGYEVLGELGRGGMGVVYKARQIRANRLVALKMIRSSGCASQQEAERFRIEAEAIARLQHPNIVQLYEVGEADGQPFFSLELCDGGSLDAKLREGRPTQEEAAALVEALAGALHCAHERGVVHRDLKPANVLLTADGVPKVTDFGLAKLLGGGQTNSGTVLGTAGYLAPEQAGGRAKEAGPAADVYGLGAILYELLTGRPPFAGATFAETLAEVLTAEPVPPGRLHPGLSRDLETVVLKCLRKAPAERYGSAAELADDLGRYRAGEPVRARPPGRMRRTWLWLVRHRYAVGLTAFVLLLTALPPMLLDAPRDAADARKDEVEPRSQHPARSAKSRDAADARKDEADADAELLRVVKELDGKKEPWRLDQLDRQRAVVPEGENAAVVVDAAARLLGDGWDAEEVSGPLRDVLRAVAPAVALSGDQAEGLRTALKPRDKGLIEARRLAEFSRGRHPIQWSRDGLSTRTPHAHRCRALSVLLRADAALRTHEGDWAGALTSCRAALCSGQSLGDEPQLISQLVRSACGREAVRASERVLAQGTPAAADLLLLEAAFRREAEEPLFLVAVRGDRGMVHWLCTSIEAGDWNIWVDFPDFPRGPAVRRAHAWLLLRQSRLVEIAELPTERWTEETKAWKEVRDTQAPPGAKLISAASATAAGSYLQSRAVLRCAAVALAVERYRQAEGRWPDRLADLEPKYARGPFLDPYDGKPLRYVRRPDGVTVYAVGPDGQDDGGKIEEEVGTLPRAGTDVGFRLWNVDRRRTPPG